MTKKRQEAVQTERTLVEQTAIEQPTAKANVKYKDTIFRMLFSEPEHLLSLYNAVTGKDYRDPEALDIVTLENAVYMGIKMTWHLYWRWGFICMSISLHTIRIFRCGICST